MSVRGSVFVGCMFLGTGIGMIFGYTGAGALIGMGIGFIAMSLIDSGRRSSGIVIRAGGSVVGSVVLMIIGLAFILGGLVLAGVIVIPELIYRSLGAIALIAIGVGFLLTALKGTRGARSVRAEEVE